jgi:D-glycero-D-manno-heptose 1,7-bisphosphate phosphatase
LERLQAAGCLLFLHTNQSGVGRGYFTLEAALSCNNEMIGQLGLGKQVFAATCICPESPDAAIEYRKPSPRFGWELLAKYGKNTNDIFYLGDNLSDLLTAQNIGCRGVGVNTGVHDLRQKLAAHGLGASFPVCDSFIEAVENLLSCSESTA